jgi:hypothetical protein
MAQVDDLLDRWKRMSEKRAPWMEYWQELADIFLPSQADFTSHNTPASRRAYKIYDGHPRLAARFLATTLDGLLKPKTNRWAWLTTLDEELAEVHEIKLWMEEAEKRMMRALYRPSAEFVLRSGEVDRSLVTLGQGALFTNLNRDRNGLKFRAFHMSNVGFDENEEGNIDTFAVEQKWKPAQIAAEYGEDALHDNMRKAMSDAKLKDKKFAVVQIILPRDDRDSKRLDHKGKPYASVHIDVEHKHIMREAGYDEFPVAVPRWDTSPGEIYARSPAMMALPDAKMLQQMAKTLIMGGQRAVDPPVWAVGDAMLSPLRSFPGGMTIIDATAMGQSGTSQPLGVLDMGKNIPLGLEMQQAVREQINQTFLLDQFKLPIEGRQMTATEVLERKEQFIRVIGPIVGRLENEYLGPLMKRVLGIMARHPAGLPPMPEALEEAGGLDQIRFEFLSPVQRARKNAEALQFQQGLSILGPLAQVPGHEGVLDYLDSDEIAKDMPDWAGIPQEWIKGDEAVEAERGQRQQQQELQTALAAAEPLSKAAQNVAGAEQSMAATGGRGPITGPATGNGPVGSET